MYIELDGESYHISISEQEKGITFIQHQDGVTYIMAGARLPQDELISYLKGKPFDKLTISNSSAHSSTASIHLFGTSFSIVSKKGITSPYINGKCVYVAAPPRSKSATVALTETLLIQEINRHVGFWEERLNILVKEIAVRKLSKSYYTISVEKSTLTFSKNLIHKSQDFVKYICSLAMFEYLNIDEPIQEKLAAAYIQDWKHQRKVFLYEQDN
ncbi:hypothetical protein [Sphingobacterium paucimobilis]|uniref:Uncharacterized protein n=1 Tax=Sphingobacterium paucimobilis HER1398 TaxID=1346330 RepID=U2J4R8_9SPHI|nr:hypothetical protein [Sphingobacterium paucimobilis]ERJ59944.1 hypothetical protein M472_14335 [Sphingobacterium paucimobilis HER1398]